MKRNRWYQKLIALNRDGTVGYTDRNGIPKRVQKETIKAEDVAHLLASQRAKIGF